MNLVRNLRLSGILEGVSFLVLLGIAMPLKYAFGFPLAVRVVGMIHGLLFLWLLIVLARTYLERRWTILSCLVVLGAALLPFGFLFVDARLRREIERAAREDALREGAPS